MQIEVVSQVDTSEKNESFIYCVLNKESVVNFRMIIKISTGCLVIL